MTGPPAGDERHEKGPVGGAVSGLKKTITAMPSTSQIAAEHEQDADEQAPRRAVARRSRR